MKRIKSYCKKAWNWLSDLFKAKFCPLATVSGGSQSAVDYSNIDAARKNALALEIASSVVFVGFLVAAFIQGGWFGLLITGCMCAAIGLLVSFTNRVSLVMFGTHKLEDEWKAILAVAVGAIGAGYLGFYFKAISIKRLLTSDVIEAEATSNPEATPTPGWWQRMKDRNAAYQAERAARQAAKDAVVESMTPSEKVLFDEVQGARRSSRAASTYSMMNLGAQLQRRR